MSLSEHHSSATQLQLELVHAHRERQARARSGALRPASPASTIRQHNPGNAVWRQYQADVAQISVQMANAHRFLDGVPNLRDILHACLNHYNITRRDLLSRQRDRPKMIMARQVTMYLSRTLTLYSFPAIARFLDHRDHTTIIHGVRKIEELLPSDERLRADIEAIKGALQS